MNDMSGTIIAKSDQINAADIIGNPITMTVREVQIKAAGSDDQPVAIFFEGERKAFRPCKGVRRLLVHAWGLDANKYIGRSLTLFCDPSVTWAGKEEGGLRVSHMSNIEGEFVFSMRTSRASTKPYKIKPLAEQRREDPATKWANAYLAKVKAAPDRVELESFATEKASKLAELETARPDLHKRCVEALTEAREKFTPSQIDPTVTDAEIADSSEGRAVEDRGERFADEDMSGGGF